MPRARTDSAIPMAKVLLCFWLRAIAVHSAQQQWPRHGYLFTHIPSAQKHLLSCPQVSSPCSPVRKSRADPLIMASSACGCGAACSDVCSGRSWTSWVVDVA